MRPSTTTVRLRAVLLSWFLRLRRGPWGGLATIVITAGVIMLMQPFAIVIYTYPFVTILVGTATFVDGSAIARIHDGIAAYLDREGIASLEDLPRYLPRD